jgi:hypothetical protein
LKKEENETSCVLDFVFYSFLKIELAKFYEKENQKIKRSPFFFGIETKEKNEELSSVF